LALRMERTYSKDKILELYLNQIYLGLGAYGVAAASLLYFDKSVHELTIAEAAYLAALPKGPNNYNPFRRRDEAIARRNYVIDRMTEDGYIAADAAEKAKKEPLAVAVRPTGAHTFAAEYFAEEVRRYIFENYGEKKLYEGGLSVRTTLDPKMQVLARKTMINGLVNFDETQGWRGPVTKIPVDADCGSPSCLRSTTNRRGSACSRRAIPAARSRRIVRSASFRSTASSGRSLRIRRRSKPPA
jgi:penicillin-binding protein 1A